eukprot:315500-Prymnesium_polylepis.1
MAASGAAAMKATAAPRRSGRRVARQRTAVQHFPTCRAAELLGYEVNGVAATDGIHAQHVRRGDVGPHAMQKKIWRLEEGARRAIEAAEGSPRTRRRYLRTLALAWHRPLLGDVQQMAYER